MEPEYKDDKLRELMLFIAQRMENNINFGATVLNKVLFFADFLAYATLGVPITGAVYQKLDHGPAPRQLLPEQERLINDGRAVLQTRELGGFVQKRLVPLDDPKLDLFTPDEIALVIQIIDTLGDKTALAMSELSHRLSTGWRAAELHEDIRYATVFLRSPMEHTATQIKFAKELDLELELEYPSAS